MNDFKKSLSAGVSAAQIAKNNIIEITEVLESVSAQVYEFFEKKVMFGKGRFNKPQKNGNPWTSTILGLSSPFTVESYDALAIWDSEGENPTELAEWSTSDFGYPCKMSYGGKDVYCRSKEDLVNELSVLLSDVKTGRAILEKVEKFDKKKLLDAEG